MRQQSRIRVLLFIALLLAGCAGWGVGSQSRTETPPPAQPYAGMQDRPIKSLSPERVADLLAGRGAGYALAAELNDYPGPMHVLELATELQLRPDQERAVRDVFTAMQQEAQRLGKQLVDLEAELDGTFRSGQITPAVLADLTNEIATVEGQLRTTHLAAHLKTKEVLTPEQVARYDQLRGYTAASGAHEGGQHGTPHHGR